MDPAHHPKIRRWDGVVAVKYADDPAASWLQLENGIKVRFAPKGDYRCGQYWQIPARTSSPDDQSSKIEWPSDDKGIRLSQSPRGIAHHYAPLGVVQVDQGEVKLLWDCRNLYPSLTSIPRLFYVSGDGQEAMPSLIAPDGISRLPQPLVVGVARAQCSEQPLVRFTVNAPSAGIVLKTEALTVKPPAKPD